MKKRVKVILILICTLFAGAFVLYSFINGGDIQEMTKAMHSIDTDSYVKVVNESFGSKKKNLLTIHSKETQKVFDYTFKDKHSEKETVDYFVEQGWQKYSVENAITWSLMKSYAVIMTSKKIPDSEIFKEIKDMNKTWKDDYSKILIEEIFLDYGQ